VKILLDECIDHRLALELPEHEVRTAPQMGWANYKNGRLLTLAQQQFEAFITIDKRLPHQQNLAKYSIAVLILDAPSNRLADMRPLVPVLLKLLATAPKGLATFVHL
jgi:hypothetical protein